MRNFHGNLKQMDKRKARLIPALFLCPDPGGGSPAADHLVPHPDPARRISGS